MISALGYTARQRAKASKRLEKIGVFLRDGQNGYVWLRGEGTALEADDPSAPSDIWKRLSPKLDIIRGACGDLLKRVILPDRKNSTRPTPNRGEAAHGPQKRPDGLFLGLAEGCTRARPEITRRWTFTPVMPIACWRRTNKNCWARPASP